MTKGFFKEIVNSSVDGIHTFDLECRCTLWNPAMERLFGIGREEVLGKRVSDVLPFVKKAGEDKLCVDVLAGESGVLITEGPGISPETGPPGLFESRYSPLLDESGEIIGGVAITRRLTASTQAEAAEIEHRQLVEILHAISTALNSSPNFDELLACILATVGQVALHDTAHIMLIEAGQAHIVGAQGYEQCGHPPVLGLHIPLADAPEFRQMVETGLSLTISDTQTHPGWLDIPETRWIRSRCSAPIHFCGETIGFINLDSAAPGSFTAIHARRLLAFAYYVGVAIGNTRLLEAEREQRLLAEAHERMSMALGAMHELPGLIELICRESVNLYKVDFAYVWLVEGDELVGFAGSGLERGKFVGTRLSLSNHDTLAVRVIRDLHPIFVNHADQSNRVNQELARLFQVKAILGVPLINRGRGIGTLMIFDTHQSQRFGPDDVKLATVLGSYAAIAIENARLYDELHQRINELAALSKTSQSLTSTLDLQETLTLITAHTTRLLGAEATSVALYDELRDDLWFAAASGKGSGFVLGKRFSVGQGIAGWAVQQGEPLLVPDVTKDPRFFQNFDQESGFTTRSILCVPLKAKRQIIGLIEVLNKENGSFNQEDLRLLSSLAAPAATAIENARLYEQAQREIVERKRAEAAEREQRKLAERLRKATATLASALDLGQVLDSILTYLQQVIPYDSACVFLIKGDYLRAVAGRGFPDLKPVLETEYLARTDHMLQELRLTKKPHYVIDAQADPNFQGWGGTDYVHGWLVAPLVVRGEVIGYLTLDSRQKAAYGQTEADLAQAFANQAAVAITNARLFEETQFALAETGALYRVGRTLAQIDNEQRMFELVLTEYLTHLNLQQGGVLIFDEDRSYGFLMAHMVGKKLVEPGLRIPVAGNPSYDRLIETRQPVAIRDAHNDDLLEPVHELVLELGVRSLLLVPIVVRGDVIGALGADSTETMRDFSDREIALIKAMAAQLSIRIENTRLFAVANQRLAELEAVHQVSLSLTSNLDLQGVLEAILESTLELLPSAQNTHIFLYQADRLTFGAALWSDGRKGEPVAQPRPHGLTATVARQGQPITVSDMHTHPLFVNEPVQWGGAIMGMPLKIGRRVVGVMNISYPQHHTWPEAELRVLKLLGDQAAIAIENARLYQAERTTRQEAQALHRAALALVSTMDLDEVIDLILLELQQVVPYDSATIQLLKNDRTEIIGGRGFPNLQETLGITFDVKDDTAYPLNYAIVKFKKPVIIADTQINHAEFFDGPHAPANIRSWLGVPMLIGERVIGMMSLDKQQTHFYTDTHAHLAGAYAAQAAIAIENARLYQQAQQEIVERKRAEADLDAYREHLEALVQERTAELEQAMAETAAARDRIDAILHSVADGLIVTDLEHKVILANPASEALLGLQLAEMLGREIGAGIENDRLQQIVYNTLEQRANRQEVDIELSTSNGGRKLVVRARTALVGGQHGQPLGTVTILQDVTRVREVDRLKTELITTAAHELRTPLTSILGFSEILLTRRLEQFRIERYLRMINEQATHLSTIVNDLLDISRLEAGRSPDLKLELIDIADLMKEVVLPFTETATGHNIQMDGLAALPLIMGDQFRLTQVGRNLLSNAVNYSAEGSTINIRARAIPGYLEISIEDEGIGITPQQQCYLFEPFYRADTSNTAIGGWGLGLAICEMVVEQHGGEIWVESEWGAGTTVHFTLPLAATQAGGST